MTKHYIQEVAEDLGFSVMSYCGYQMKSCLGVIVKPDGADSVGVFASKVLANAANMTENEFLLLSAALGTVKREPHGNWTILYFPDIPFDKNVEVHRKF